MWVHVGADISSATGGILTTLSSGRAVIGLKFTHHFIKKLCLRRRKAAAYSQQWIMDTVHWRHEVISKFSWLLMEKFAVLQGEKWKRKN